MKSRKKKLLFVIDSLGIGGAEKSLVTLLNLMDYTQYEVHLQTFAPGREFEQLLPKEVRLLPQLPYFAYSSLPWKSIGRKVMNPKAMTAQIRYSGAIRMHKLTHAEKAVVQWLCIRECIDPAKEYYDAAIAYAQGMPAFYVSEKCKAGKKAVWINAMYWTGKQYNGFTKRALFSFDKVNAVSDTVAEQLMSDYGLPESRIMIIRDILDPGMARRMASLPSGAEKEMNGHGTRILSVGRLAKCKGYETAVQTADILRQRGIAFTWYVVGEGAMRTEIESLISGKGLQDQFVLLGSRSNPYPYFAACDIYVQSSLYEGFGITLAEAKMFAKPIVVTDFKTAHDQIRDGENGLIVGMTPEAIAEGIIRMVRDEELSEKFTGALREEKLGNPEEINKLYTFLEA